MGDMTKGNNKRRFRLWQRDPHCFYCGAMTVLYNPKRGEIMSYNVATVEHLRSRNHPDRLEPNDGNTERTVLACNKCNNERNRQEELVLGIEELQERSQRHV